MSENDAKVVASIKSYVKTVEAFEKASLEFNNACSEVRSFCQPGVHIVRIDGKAYAVSVDNDSSFEVKPLGKICDDGQESCNICHESDFTENLQRLLNSHSSENESNTPDFVLATFMSRCLAAFNAGIRDRDRYYNINAAGTGCTVGQ